MNRVASLALALCLGAALSLAQSSKASTPLLADGHPDLNGLWNGNANNPFLKSADPLTANLASRGGNLLNFERDGALVRRADQNKPIYKPEFWEKIQQLDQDGNNQDPSYGCMPGGVPRIGPPMKIVQTSKELVFLYVSPPAPRLGRSVPRDSGGWPCAHNSAGSGRDMEGRIRRPLGGRHARRR